MTTRAFALTLALVAVANPASGQAPDGARVGLALKILEQLHVKGLVEGEAAVLEKRLQATFSAARKPGAPEWFLQKLGPLQGEVQQLVRAELNWELVGKDIALSYASLFTESELRELMAFYETPTGRKLSASALEIAGIRVKEAGSAELKWELIGKHLALSYASLSTESELRELMAFYETPTGPKLSANAPEAGGRTKEILNGRLEELKVKVTELTKKRLQQAR